MKKFLSAALAALLLVGALAGCSGSSAGENGELVLYTWENMFPQEVLDGFTEETGIQVTYSNFDTDETMLARLETAKGGDYDLVIADDYIIETAIQQGWFRSWTPRSWRITAASTRCTRASSSTPRTSTPCPTAPVCRPSSMTPAWWMWTSSYADLWDPSLEA